MKLERIAETDAGGDGDIERRQTYVSTARGRRVAHAEAQRLDGLVVIARTCHLLLVLV